jgi:hypothetical protein
MFIPLTLILKGAYDHVLFVAIAIVVVVLVIIIITITLSKLHPPSTYCILLISLLSLPHSPSYPPSVTPFLTPSLFHTPSLSLSLSQWLHLEPHWLPSSLTNTHTTKTLEEAGE